MSSVVLSDILIEETLEVVEQAAEINAGAGNINEQNALEGGDQAVEINADATDNLEVGEQAAVIQVASNDNEVVEEYSQELDFANQPPSQYQPKTEFQLLKEGFTSFVELSKSTQASQNDRHFRLADTQREDCDNIRQSIREMSESSRKRQEDFAKAMIDSRDRYREQQERYREEQERSREEDRRVLQEQLLLIEQDAERNRRMLKTVSDKVDKSQESVERRLDEVQSSVEVMSIQLAELVKSVPPRHEEDPGDPRPPSFQQVAEMIDNSAERICNRMSESIHEVTNTMNVKIDNNSQYILQRMDTALRDVHERIDVVSDAAYVQTVKLPEETPITPDSAESEQHVLKAIAEWNPNAEYVAERKSVVPIVAEEAVSGGSVAERKSSGINLRSRQEKLRPGDRVRGGRAELAEQVCGVEFAERRLKEVTSVSLDSEQHVSSTPEDECVTGGESQQHTREDFDPGGCVRSPGSEGVELGGRYVALEQSHEPVMLSDSDIGTPSTRNRPVDIGDACGGGNSSDDGPPDRGRRSEKSSGVGKGSSARGRGLFGCSGRSTHGVLGASEVEVSKGLEEARIGPASGAQKGRSGIG